MLTIDVASAAKELSRSAANWRIALGAEALALARHSLLSAEAQMKSHRVAGGWIP